MVRRVPLGQGLKVDSFADMKGMTPAIKGGVKIYHYWTNFDRKYPDNFEIYQEVPYGSGVGPDLIEKPGWWWRFTTNIEPDDFDFNWDDKTKRRFLFQMDESYNRRQVESK